MVLLHVPYTNEELEFLNQNEYRKIYDERGLFVTEAQKKFKSNLDIKKVIEECKKLCTDNDKDVNLNEKSDKFIQSKEITENFVQIVRNNLDDNIHMKIMEKTLSVVRKCNE